MARNVSSVETPHYFSHACATVSTLSIFTPEIPNQSELKAQLTFIPAFAVEATVKESFAIVQLCAQPTKIHPSASLFHTRGSNWFAAHPSHLPQKSQPFSVSQWLGNMLKKGWLNIREAENIVTPAQLMTHNKPFPKDMSFSFCACLKHLKDYSVPRVSIGNVLARGWSAIHKDSDQRPPDS